MNRDERPERGATSLELFQGSIQGMELSYPVDAGSGGTWIGVNARGLFMALLNEYPVQASGRPGIQSRGGIIPPALGARDLGEAAAMVEGTDPRNFGPCVVVLAWLDGALLALRSDGNAWTREVHPRKPTLFVSSGIDAEGVRRVRGELFAAALERGPAALDAFHRSHEPQRGPHSVCMHRDGSRSVSLTHVSTDVDGAVLRYWPLGPCEIGESAPLIASIRAVADRGGIR